MGAIFKREFRSYFTNMTGYIIIGVMFVFCGIFSTFINLLQGYASFEYILNNQMLILIVVIPILAMRSLAEDRRTKTDQLLYSLPMSTASVVVGKYLAMLAVYFLSVLGMAVVPVILSGFGDVSFTAAYSSLFGFFLLGAALLAICMFFSSMTESQIVAAVLGVGGAFVLYLLGSIASIIPDTAAASFACFVIVALIIAISLYVVTKNYIVAVSALIICLIPLVLLLVLASDTLAGLFPDVIKYLAIFDRFEKFTGGIFDLTAVIYYLSVIAFFVFVSVQTMEKRRWS